MEYQYAEQDSDLIIITAALPEPECMKAKKTLIMNRNI